MHAGFGRPGALAMHYSAKLGFHAPWLANLPSDKQYTTEDIIETFSLSQQTIKELARHGRIPLELFIEFLDKGRSEFYFIDTAYKAAQLGVMVGGFYDHELYREKVLWPKDGWFGLVVPTRETAYWTILAETILENRWDYGIGNWLGYSSRSGPQRKRLKAID
jgi:hypothetical protein